MADVQNDEADQAAKEALMSSLIHALEDNRDALRFLPEMLTQLIEMQNANEEKATQANNLSGYRDDDYKTTLFQRENEKLKGKVNSLLFDIKAKNERIKALQETIESQKAHINAMSDTQAIQKLSKEDRSFELQEASKKLMARNDELIREVEVKDKQLKEKTDKLLSLENKLETLKKETGFRDATISSLKSETSGIKNKTELMDSKRYDDLIREVEAKKEQLKEQSERFHHLQEQHKSVLSEKALQDEEIEQMKKRMDAWEVIQSYYRSHEEVDDRIYYPRLVCLIFEEAYERTKEAKKAYFEYCKELSRGFVQLAPNRSREFLTYEKQKYPQFNATFSGSLLRRESQYPTDVFDALMLTLKETAGDCNLDLFVQDVQRSVWNKWHSWCNEDKYCRILPNQCLLQDARIITYITKCIQLTWRMVTQVPAMKIEYRALHLEDGTHKKVGYHSSPYMQAKVPAGQVSGEEIACYLWPGLFDGGGRLIRAGEVLCKMKK